jgi:hypothetical protein
MPRSKAWIPRGAKRLGRKFRITTGAFRNDVYVGASGPCSVVVRRRSGPHPPLRFHGSVVCAALCQGSVDSSAASRDCRNPPLRLLRC